MSDAGSTADKLEHKHDEENAPAKAGEAKAEAPADEPSAEAADAAAPAEELAAGTNLMQALIAAQKEAQSNKEGWQRSQAEFANYKKRVARERSELFQRASLDTLQSLLPVIDDFDRAFENVPEDISGNPWIGGVAMIQRKFETLLEKFEIEAIDPTGEPFDPNFHEAIGADDSDEVESGHVTATLQKGYRAGKIVLRLALVRVAG